jgi:hypothetical protein
LVPRAEERRRLLRRILPRVKADLRPVFQLNTTREQGLADEDAVALMCLLIEDAAQGRSVA